MKTETISSISFKTWRSRLQWWFDHHNVCKIPDAQREEKLYRCWLRGESLAEVLRQFYV